MTSFELAYYPWITQYRDKARLEGFIREFASEVGRHLCESGHPCRLEVLPYKSVPELVTWVCDKPNRIALMNPLGFAIAFARAGEGAASRPEAIAVALRPDPQNGEKPAGPSYRAQIYVRKDSGITTLAELRGRSMAFGTPQSTSNFLVPARKLRAEGIHPFTAFSSVAFLGSHDKVARSVYDGWVVAGAGHDGVILDLAKAVPEAPEVLQRLCWTDEIPSDPVVAHAADPQWLEWLATSFVAAGETGAGKPGQDPNADFGFWGGSTRLGRTKSLAYAPLKLALDDLRFTPEDVLR